ncbi:MAG: bifunctional methionine sulfoxide reductase B/A protein [Phycisphaerae bacterium]|nr:bifunctional methionine sulfoxide reductase B/A protein [Phycisphaerae bacterium]
MDTTSAPKPDAPRYSRSAHDLTPLSKERTDQLAASLTDEERRIILRKGTEPAFCGNLLDNKKDGVYLCRLCSLPLFSSHAKFNSGTGWPSFFKPVDPDHVRYERDTSHAMTRVEILCARCGAHLGHVFDDGPRETTGLRYCLNSAALEFHEKGADLPAAARPIMTETAYFAGGCFWGVEDRFQQTPGVIDALSGYMGGSKPDPTYRQVCEGDTGHAETVRVAFDPTRVSYDDLLAAFFKYHDPTQLNRQGPDVGSQYRSAIFPADAGQLKAARAFVDAQQANPRFKGRRVVTQVLPLDQAGAFFPAEDDHQDYHEKHGGHCPLPSDP